MALKIANTVLNTQVQLNLLVLYKCKEESTQVYKASKPAIASIIIPKYIK